MRTLADRIATAAGTPSAISLAFTNLSSLGAADAAEVRSALERELEHRKFWLVMQPDVPVQVQVTVSRSVFGFMLVAEIHRGGETDVAIVEVTPSADATISSQREPTLVRRLLFRQAGPILDFLQDAGPEGPPRLLVLSATQIALYLFVGESWELQGSQVIPPVFVWPRDLRGEIQFEAPSGFAAYLPGATCRGNWSPSLKAECYPESGAIWPASEETRTSFVSNRNYFAGYTAKLQGTKWEWPPFFSLTPLTTAGRNSHWILAELDERSHLFGALKEPLAVFTGWGDDIASVSPECGAAWQVLVTGTGDWTQPDHIQIYEITDHQAVAVGQPLEFPGPILALWPSGDGKSARVVSRNLQTGMYEASIASVSCSD